MQQGVKFTEVLTWMTLENFEPSALWLDFENSAKGGFRLCRLHAELSLLKKPLG